MSQQELLKRVSQVLERARVEFMVTGSLASSLQGEPRSTHDIDLVVSMPPDAVSPLLAAFASPDYYLSEEAIRKAIAGKKMFNLLSVLDGEKVDFWLLTDEAYDRSRFSRRLTETIQGHAVPVSAPEDTIIAKLKWCKSSGGSEKQFRDALRVYEVQLPVLDRNYMRKWVGLLGLQELWERLENEAIPI